MKYDWDINKLKNLKTVLNKIKEVPDEYSNIELIKDEINSVNEMLRIMKNPYTRVKIFQEENDETFFDHNKLISNSRYQMFNEILPYVKTLMVKQSKKFSKFNNNHKEVILPKLNNQKDLVSIAYEVYKTLPTTNNIYKDFFLEYTNPNNNKLKLISNEINGNLSVYAYIYLLYNPVYKPYILMTQDKTIEDISVLCHEVGHAIFFNPSVGTLNRNTYLDEVEGYYFEYMTRKYLEKHGYDKKVIEELEYKRFTTIYEGYVAFYIMNTLINKYEFNKKISYDKVMYYIINKVNKNFSIENINEAYINFSLNQNNLGVSRYFISYLIALDIEEVDKKDPEYAFHMLKQVCKINSDYIYKKLRENSITFMDDGCKNLEKKIKYMNNI